MINGKEWQSEKNWCSFEISISIFMSFFIFMSYKMTWTIFHRQWETIWEHILDSVFLSIFKFKWTSFMQFANGVEWDESFCLVDAFDDGGVQFCRFNRNRKALNWFNWKNSKFDIQLSEILISKCSQITVCARKMINDPIQPDVLLFFLSLFQRIQIYHESWFCWWMELRWRIRRTDTLSAHIIHTLFMKSYYVQFYIFIIDSI